MRRLGGASVPRGWPGWALPTNPRRWVLTGVLAFLGCGAGDREPQPLLVLAAANLTGAMEAAEAAYETDSREAVTVVFGSSGNLAAQIRHGAPADVYLSANERFFDELAADGFLDPATRVEVAVGRLALVVPPGRTVVERLERLDDPAYRVLAMANPEHAPYGEAARDALRAAGVWSAVKDRVVMGENVAQALQYVRTGNADAGLVALSLVVSPDPGRGLPHAIVDPGLHLPLSQVGGVVAGSRRPEAATAFLTWMTEGRGRDILRDHGFESPRP